VKPNGVKPLKKHIVKNPQSSQVSMTDSSQQIGSFLWSVWYVIHCLVFFWWSLGCVTVKVWSFSSRYTCRWSSANWFSLMSYMIHCPNIYDIFLFNLCNTRIFWLDECLR
jgi:hypothetical protein